MRFQALPRGPFSLVLADPPWRFEVWDRATGTGRSADQHYKTLTIAQIKTLPVRRVLRNDALLVLWVSDPNLPAAFEVAAAWGFRTYVTVLFRWIKTTDGQYKLFEPGAERLNFGTGYHTRAGGCEECWLFRRGRGLSPVRHDIRREIFAPVREHSRKPDEIRTAITALYGKQDHGHKITRLELFARQRAPGWTAWGNEVRKFAQQSEEREEKSAR